MRRQKQINKLLNSIKTERQVYNTYGYIFKVYSSTVFILIDFIVPSARMLSLFALWLKKKNKDKHLFNIDITKIMECVRKWI